MPPLLAVARAAQAWMEGRPHRAPRPAPRTARRHRPARRTRRPARSVFIPVWAAYPAVGFSGRDALPGLLQRRRRPCRRPWPPGHPGRWPSLHLVAESVRRIALRELVRLETAAEQGRGIVAGGDKRFAAARRARRAAAGAGAHPQGTSPRGSRWRRRPGRRCCESCRGGGWSGR